MKNIFISIFIFSTIFELSAAENWKALILKSIPVPIQSIIPGKTSQREVEKKIGKPALVEKDKQYYEINNFKYSLEITYSNKVVKDYSYTFTESRPDFAPLKINVSELSPDKGNRFLKYNDKQGEIIVDASDKKVYSVRIK
jgi:hypothetical protein